MKYYSLYVILALAHYSFAQRSNYQSLVLPPSVIAEVKKSNKTQAMFDFEREVLKSQTIKPSGRSQITLPLLFHIIGQPGLVNDVNATIVEDQIIMLNKAFSGGLDPLRLDSGIRFCLADIGSVPNSIIKNDLTWQLALGNILNLTKGERSVAAIQPDQAINVWIVPMDTSFIGVGIPPLYSTVQEGIIINAIYFREASSKNAYGKTSFVHLMGRYLGLKPLWGEGQCQDDGIMDTPIHNAPNTRCITYGHMSGMRMRRLVSKSGCLDQKTEKAIDGLASIID